MMLIPQVSSETRKSHYTDSKNLPRGLETIRNTASRMALWDSTFHHHRQLGEGFKFVVTNRKRPKSYNAKAHLYMRANNIAPSQLNWPWKSKKSWTLEGAYSSEFSYLGTWKPILADRHKYLSKPSQLELDPDLTIQRDGVRHYVRWCIGSTFRCQGRGTRFIVGGTKLVLRSIPSWQPRPVNPSTVPRAWDDPHAGDGEAGRGWPHGAESTSPQHNVFALMFSPPYGHECIYALTMEAVKDHGSLHGGHLR